MSYSSMTNITFCQSVALAVVCVYVLYSVDILYMVNNAHQTRLYAFDNCYYRKHRI